MKICCRTLFFCQKSSGDFVFQEDGATSHHAKWTVQFLQQNVTNFIEPSVWPPNSPDLNPVDYAVWGALQQAVYRVPVVGLDDFKNRVCTCLASLDQLISKAVDHWRPRLKAGVQVYGPLNSSFLDCLVVVSCCYLDIVISMHCSCFAIVT